MKNLMMIALLTFLVLNLSHAQGRVGKSFQCDLHPNSQEPCLLSWSPNGKWIATTTKALIKVDIWDTDTKNLFTTLPTHADVLSWNRQGNLLATVTEYEINVWDVESGEKVNTVDFRNIFQDEIERDTREVWPNRFTAIDWNDNTSQIAIVTLDWIAIWQLSTGNFIVLELPSDYDPDHSTPLSVAWSPLGNHLAVAFADGQVALYNSMTFAIERVFGDDGYYMNGFSGWQSITWSPDGRFLATDGINALEEVNVVIRIFELATDELTLIQGHSRPINTVTWSTSGEYIASASGYDVLDIPMDNTIRIWDAESYELVREISFEEAITSISWNPEGTKLAAVDLSGTVYIIEIEEPNLYYNEKNNIESRPATSATSARC